MAAGTARSETFAQHKQGKSDDNQRMRLQRTIESAALLLVLLLAPSAGAQAPATAENQTEGNQPIATFKVNVVARNAKAVNYHHRSGWTTLDFKGTDLMPKAHGRAHVEAKKGYVDIEVKFESVGPAQKFGPEYLTYVLWAITPEGRPSNLGEIVLGHDGNGKLNVTTELQVFGMIVTAEPYYAVILPSDVVVLENIVRPDTVGAVEDINARYDALQRGGYLDKVDRATLKPIEFDPKIPLELYEARNAVQIARWNEAEKYAAESFARATKLLDQVDDYQQRKQKKPVVTASREVGVLAEDARAIAVRREAEERLAEERRIAAERQAAAQAQAEEEARRRAEAEAQQKAEAEKRAQAERDRMAAQLEAERAARAKADADAASLAARKAAEEAEQRRLQAEAEKEELRRKLFEQFNRVLETRDTPRGLVVNLPDVLFDINQYALKPVAREKLARFAGIVLAYPGLNLDIEGHTDSTGTEDYNLKLSQRRGGSVQKYLLDQGLTPEIMTVRGLGEADPVGDNKTAAGRKLNRRVEIIVSGEVIGNKVGKPVEPTPNAPN